MCEGLLDGAAKHELLAHDAHRLPHGLANDRLAGSLHKTLRIAADVGLGVAAEFDKAPGKHQAPGRSIHKQRFGLPDMAFPVPAGELVGDQPVGRFVVGNPQQRFGEAHQHDPFFGGERVFLHEGIDTSLRRSVRPDFTHQLPRDFLHAGLVPRRQLRKSRKLPHASRFIGKKSPPDFRLVWQRRKHAIVSFRIRNDEDDNKCPMQDSENSTFPVPHP